MFSFLPGQMLADAAASVDDSTRAKLFEAVGEAVGSVTAALCGFDHAAAHRDFYWDLRCCEEVIKARSSYVHEDRRALLGGFLARYCQDIKPTLPRLRKSVVHNDPNDYNLVVLDNGRVGVLDFGDMVYSYTCADAAIGMAYLLLHCPVGSSLVECVLPFVCKYHQMCPLTEDEARVLFGLAIMRICTSVCMSAYQSSLEPDNPYLLISSKPAWALLERLAAGGEETSAPARLLRACGFADHIGPQ